EGDLGCPLGQVLGAHGPAVHGADVGAREGPAGLQGLGEDAAGGLQQRHALGRQRGAGGEDAGEGFVELEVVGDHPAPFLPFFAGAVFVGAGFGGGVRLDQPRLPGTEVVSAVEGTGLPTAAAASGSSAVAAYWAPSTSSAASSARRSAGAGPG